MKKLVALLLLLSCGGNNNNAWVQADYDRISNGVRAQSVIYGTICSPPDDAGTCVPGQVRQLSRDTLCDLESILTTHGQAVPEGGVPCAPR